jgi:N-carbamoyl-L-amino-acid hydrolase
MADSVQVRPALKVNGERLWSSLMSLARIGATPGGGVNRQALTEGDASARNQFIAWCEAAGCTIRVDAIGNLIARLPGRDAGLPAIMMGSHLDTQPTGGKFDGAYGVMAGLEVLRTLRDACLRPAHAIELVAWTNEEGVRFVPSMMGSSVYAGLMRLEDALAVRDADGVTVRQAMAEIDVQPQGEAFGLPAAYFEAHIEQGPVLEAEEKTIGVVTAAQGQCWFKLVFHGRAAHAGSTPMSMRADALAAAAMAVTSLNRIGRQHPPGCATSGRMIVSPNSPNVIPENVIMTAEMRHPDDAVRGMMEDQFRAAIQTAAWEHGVRVEIEKVLEQPAAPFDAACVAQVRESAGHRGYACMDIVSGAAHDAVAMSRIVPAGMIFVPCAAGISHNELESAEPGDLEAGCQVLCDCVLAASAQ